jgi:lactose/L-arabinose transport system permease protein
MKKHMGKLGRVTMNKRKGLNMEQKRNLTGWAFLLPASILIFVFCFYPMVQALILSFQKGTGSAVQPAGFANYARILKDATFQQCLFNTIFYFVIQVPIMLILALILAQLLNSPDIKGKGIYRTMIFLPCATSLVSYSMIFKSLFANDGLVNRVLSTVGIPTVDWFQNAWAARWVIVIALIWRWTGYNMVFYLAGLQNIDYSIYEAARIDGASPIQQFIHLTIPLLKPTILLTAIMSTSGTLQLFDESVNLTAGGPGKATMTLTHYIYNISFVETPKFNYAAALSVFILVVVAVLSAIQMKVGDKRD